MESQRQLLRVSVKLMGLTVIVFFIYILFAGMFISQYEHKEVLATIDISGIEAGEYKQIKLDGRPLVLLHRDDKMIAALSQPNPLLYRHEVDNEIIGKWFVAYAYDPLLGCEIKLIKDKSMFKSVCGRERYDLAGRPYSKQQSQLELLQPAYKVESQRLIIFSN